MSDFHRTQVLMSLFCYHCCEFAVTFNESNTMFACPYRVCVCVCVCVCGFVCLWMWACGCVGLWLRVMCLLACASTCVCVCVCVIGNINSCPDDHPEVDSILVFRVKTNVCVCARGRACVRAHSPLPCLVPARNKQQQCVNQYRRLN